MRSDVNCSAAERHNAEPPGFQKRIGSTTYRVIVHFSKTSKETAEDKLLRLMKNEMRQSA